MQRVSSPVFLLTYLYISILSLPGVAATLCSSIISTEYTACILAVVFPTDNAENILFNIVLLQLVCGVVLQCLYFPSDPSGSCIPVNTWVFHIMQSVLSKQLQ